MLETDPTSVGVLRFVCVGAVAAIALGLAIGASARVSSPGAGAARFMKTVVREKLAKRYDLVWESLYPAHQQVATREAYVGCESLNPWPGAVASSVRVLRAYQERIRVAGDSQERRTIAVRVRATAYAAGFPLPVVVTATYHALRAEGGWTWILSQAQYAYYSAGTCPYG